MIGRRREGGLIMTKPVIKAGRKENHKKIEQNKPKEREGSRNHE